MTMELENISEPRTPAGISSLMLDLSENAIARPMIRHHRLVVTSFLEAARIYERGTLVLKSFDLDTVFNPLCYNVPPYDRSTRAALYSLPPARASGIVIYTFSQEPMPNRLHSVEILGSGARLNHQLDIPTHVMTEILDANKIKCGNGNMFYIPYGAFEIITTLDGELRGEVRNGYSVTALRIKSHSGWHSRHGEIGLPFDDKRAHNGHSGDDRYLWRLSDRELKTLGGNGFLGSAAHIHYSPYSYGQNVVVAFGPSVPLLLWEGVNKTECHIRR